MKKRDELPELTEDMEVVGPGQILADARESMKLTQQQVADKLNFRVALVQDIEADNFDKSLPATYNRGYLRNYAKLVNVAADDVLASYEMLGVAEAQGAEMQSFSKITEKQAQNNRLMWITYLILAALVASTVVWWLQDIRATKVTSIAENTAEQTNEQVSLTTTKPSVNTKTSNQDERSSEASATDERTLSSPTNLEQSLEENVSETLELEPLSITSADAGESAALVEAEQAAAVNVVFEFSGDCWVNIYDATGERIAWGVKKSGYVMTISGVPPFSVTLGKPELVAINFDGQDVDMSPFNVGNIAKFSLPVTP